MNKNKIFALGATALTLAGSMGGVTAMAADDTKDTEVKYQVEESYDWSIHSEIDFGKNAGSKSSVEKENNAVKVTKNVLLEGNKLKISVKGSGTSNAFSITNGKTEVLSYKINDGASDLAVGGTVLEVNAGTNVGSKALKFTLATANREAEIAGSYTGTVTYTAEVVAQ